MVADSLTSMNMSLADMTSSAVCKHAVQ